MNDRFRIGLDLDGVVYNYDKTVRYMLRTMRGHQNNPALQQEATSWTSTEEAVSKHDWQWVWTKAIELGLFRYGHLYSGAIEGVRALADLGEVVVITSRHPKATQDTLDWLAYLKLPFREIHILGSEPKSTIKCDLYVDDRPENIIDLATNTDGLAVLWKRPWNADFYKKHFVVTEDNTWEGIPNTGAVDTWEELVGIARDIKRFRSERQREEGKLLVGNGA